MIKNMELLTLIEKKKSEVSCENCTYCNLNAFHHGKWYCKNEDIHVGVPVDIEKCFSKRVKPGRKQYRERE